MRELLTPKRTFVLVLALFFADLIAVEYMLVVNGLGLVPLDALPLLYWVLLFLLPAVLLAGVLKWKVQPLQARYRTQAQITLVLLLFAGGASLFMALLNNSTLPKSGGSTAFNISMACVYFVVAFANFKRLFLSK
jgi:hypothetical protein